MKEAADKAALEDRPRREAEERRKKEEEEKQLEEDQKFKRQITMYMHCLGRSSRDDDFHDRDLFRRMGLRPDRYFEGFDLDDPEVLRRIREEVNLGGHFDDYDFDFPHDERGYHRKDSFKRSLFRKMTMMGERMRRNDWRGMSDLEESDSDSWRREDRLIRSKTF